MKRIPFAAFAALLLLSACFPRHPELPLIARSPDHLLQYLERHRRDFASLTGLGNLVVRKRGGTRAFDTVGIAIEGRERIRIEAYGPLGQSLAAIVWNGSDLLLRMSPDEGVTRAAPERLERLLGRGVEPSALCALLSGNIPDPAHAEATKLLCTETNECTLEMRTGDLLGRVRLSLPERGDPVIDSYERFRSGNLLYIARFSDTADVSGFRLPMNIVIESPADHVGLALTYSDVAVNVPLDSASFQLDDN